MKASDLFIKSLEALGVDTIFGIPGEENGDFMISLLNSKIEFIICRHEQNASFMAGMYGHLTGKPGVCLATLGPGATNLLTGVANSNMDRAPVIAIIGQASTERMHKESHQNMDAITMYEPVSKWATTIRAPGVIPEVVAKAYKIAIAAKPGATVIELPEDIAKMETNEKPLIDLIVSENREPADSEINEAAELIKQSKKPFLLIGAGCVRSPCQQELVEFMDKTGMYCAVTFMGKGAVGAQHKQSLYCVGLGMKDIAVQALDQADLVICVGYDMVEWPPHRWNEKHSKKVLHIDAMPAEVDKDYVPSMELIGDIRATFTLLNERFQSAEHKEYPEFAKLRTQITEELQEYNHDQSYPMKPQRILNDLRKLMADDDILISDVGAHKMWVARQYPTYLPRTCFISNGFCSMANAMPGAFAAKQLFPEKNVVALCGDGGFMMSIQTLPTAVRYKVPFVVLLWEDNFYGLIKWKQDMEFHKESHVDLVNPDLVELSKSFGCHAQKVSSADELAPALEKAFAQKDKPTVIVVAVDYAENMKLTKRLGQIVSR